MNKQDIKKVINYMQNMDLSVFIDKDEACGVIDMVTKLLQQQLTNESEIKRLQDEVESLRNWNACEKEQYSDLLKSDKRRIELEEENEELRKQLTNGWIPVSERLPEESGHYLVTYHEWGKGEYLPEFDFTCVKILRFYHGEFKMPVCCNDKIEQDIGREVLAWRELPEIYKEDKDAERN